jgi:glycosyltransferase involved in cell wall biosynthesis
MSRARRVALVSGWPISPDQRDSGFMPRYVDLVEQLSDEHELLVVHLDTDPERFARHRGWADERAEVVDVPVPALGGSRGDRVVASARRLVAPAPVASWESGVERELRTWEPDVVVTVVDPLGVPLRATTRSFPTVSFVEEDQSGLPENHRSWSGRALIRLEELARRRSSPPPAVAVVISEHEVPWAHRRFPRSRVLVVPHRIDLHEWEAPVEPDPDTGPDDVLVVGDMASDRNARGLRAVAQRLVDRRSPRPRRITVISHSPPHPSLSDLPDGFLRLLGQVDDPRPYYRAAGQVLVPSFVVTGVKTTILQAWATGTPVVTTGPAARSTGATPDIDVMSGETPDEVADAIVRVAGDPQLRGRLARAGRDRLHAAHSREAAMAAIDRALDAAVEQGPAPASLVADLRTLARLGS